MAAIYFHIPFCKQACHYCNFHFSTSQKYRSELLSAMKKELALRYVELPKTPLQSIYFGGGTPSLLSAQEIDELLKETKRFFTWSDTIEITLEMNPDDHREDYLAHLKAIGVNRLSLGIQSFYDEELTQMNRAHNAQEAYWVMDEVKQHFSNFSMDLIYGVPNSTLSSWQRNLEIALSFSPPHLSSYALTVEPQTVLHKQVKTKAIRLLEEELVVEQFDHLVAHLEAKGYHHYEISNFGKPNFHSVNNSAYWAGKPYLGIGPSAHSFFKNQRSWNVNNNKKYMEGITNENLAIEREQLTKIDLYNEYIMTGLRTSNGVALTEIQSRFGEEFAQLFERQVEKQLQQNHLFWDGDTIRVPKSSRFLVDGIASDFFLINL